MTVVRWACAIVGGPSLPGALLPGARVALFAFGCAWAGLATSCGQR